MTQLWVAQQPMPAGLHRSNHVPNVPSARLQETWTCLRLSANHTKSGLSGGIMWRPHSVPSSVRT